MKSLLKRPAAAIALMIVAAVGLTAFIGCQTTPQPQPAPVQVVPTVGLPLPATQPVADTQPSTQPSTQPAVVIVPPAPPTPAVSTPAPAPTQPQILQVTDSLAAFLNQNAGLITIVLTLFGVKHGVQAAGDLTQKITSAYQYIRGGGKPTLAQGASYAGAIAADIGQLAPGAAATTNKIGAIAGAVSAAANANQPPQS